MSIAPPSDIILDVAQAADPIKVQAATAKLARLASGSGAADDFSSVLNAAAPAPAPSPSHGAALSPNDGYGAARIQTRPASPYQKFEAILLQNFMQDILPKDQDLFGDAASADICRSMLAEQLANQVAKTGKLGIAKAIEAAHGPAGAAKAAQALTEAEASAQAGFRADQATLSAGRGLHVAAALPAEPAQPNATPSASPTPKPGSG